MPVGTPRRDRSCRRPLARTRATDTAMIAAAPAGLRLRTPQRPRKIGLARGRETPMFRERALHHLDRRLRAAGEAAVRRHESIDPNSPRLLTARRAGEQPR